MSHKKLLTKHSGVLNKENRTPDLTHMDVSIFEKFIAAVRKNSTPVQLQREVASSSQAPKTNNQNFFEDTKDFIANAKICTALHEEQIQVSEYRAKLLRYLSVIGETAAQPPLTEIVSNNRESQALDLSMQTTEEPNTQPINKTIILPQTEPLNLSITTNSSAVESTKQPMKRPANEVIKKSNLKVYKAAKTLQKQPTHDTLYTTNNTSNKEIRHALLMNQLPPTPAASPRCMPHKATTENQSTPLKKETYFKSNTPSTSSASSIASENLDDQQPQNFVINQQIPQSSSIITNHRSHLNASQTKKVLIKICLNMSDEIKQLIDDKTVIECGFEWVVLGQNGTKIMKDALFSINWSSSGPAITRKILVLLFTREVLSTHTLSGRPSPAFINLNKPIKGQLDPLIVSDLIEFMTLTKEMSSREVRNAITTKCADEFKMLRQRIEGEQQQNASRKLEEIERTN